MKNTISAVIVSGLSLASSPIQAHDSCSQEVRALPGDTLVDVARRLVEQEDVQGGVSALVYELEQRNPQPLGYRCTNAPFTREVRMWYGRICNV